jgi:LacI family transcriptional regulator
MQHAKDVTITPFGRRTLPRALVTMDSTRTQGRLLGLRLRGLRIQRHVSLLGFNAFDLATFTDPPIVVVTQPAGEIGPLPARLLLERLENRRLIPWEMCFPTQLIERWFVRLSDKDTIP